MKLHKHCHYLRKLFYITSPALLLLFAFPTHLLAQPSSVKVSVNFPSGDPKGTPARSSGGGKRGNSSCLTIDKNKPTLTALMPTRENKSLTLAENPDFYLYIPQTKAQIGEFILRSNEEDIYQTSFKLPGQPGIVKLTIPPKVSLKTGSKYQWYFTIVCNPDDRSADEYTEGTIERTAISSSVSQALEKATPLKQAEIYAKYDIWPETMTKVVQMREEKPNEWQGLLKSVGLEVIADEPLLNITELSDKP